MSVVALFPPCGSPSAPVAVELPLSKSESARRLVLDRLAGVATPAWCVARCGDTDRMLDALALLREGGVATIDVGDAGTAMRFLTALSAAVPGARVTLSGSRRMHLRPLRPLVDALRGLGADIVYKGVDGFAPLAICGRELEGGSVDMSGSVSSQFASALMMIAPAMKRGLSLRLLPPVVSWPYISMTLSMLGRYGVTASAARHADGSVEVTVVPGRLTAPEAAAVERDWTAASYWYEIAALGGPEVSLPGLTTQSVQGDAVVPALFDAVRAAARSGEMWAHDFSDTPDLVPSLAATCCALGVRFRFDGVATLADKECDRLAALKTELGRLGRVLETAGSGSALRWAGALCEPQPRPSIATYGDHRVAMALAPLSILFPGLQIQDPEVVDKSYPGFWADLGRAGFRVEMY